jgi:predicted membrane channel-forming protein YqfA (hemolysin III family)
MKLLLAALLLNETTMFDFAFLLIKLAGIAVLVIGLVIYVLRSPTAPPAKHSAAASSPTPQTQGERTLWVIVWLIVAAVIYFPYSLVSGMIG